MTWFEKFKNMNEKELVSWLNTHVGLNEAPWVEWFEELYCNNCRLESGYMTDCTGEYEWRVPCEYSWCELNDFKCKFFPDMEESPDNKDMIKMWLQSEVE